MICCSTTPSAIDSSSGIAPICPSGDPYRDPTTKQFHYCSNTNYACPEGFVCKQAVNVGGQYVCCSGKSTCQKGWIPFLDRGVNLPVQCSPFDKNACKPPGPPYKCQQSTKPGEYLCCMESVIAMSSGHRNDLGFGNETIGYELSTKSSVPSLTTPIFRWRNGGGWWRYGTRSSTVFYFVPSDKLKCHFDFWFFCVIDSFSLMETWFDARCKWNFLVRYCIMQTLTFFCEYRLFFDRAKNWTALVGMNIFATMSLFITTLFKK